MPSTIAYIMILMVLQLQFIPETSIAKNIAIVDMQYWIKYRDTDSNVTLKKYCNTDSDAEKSIDIASNSDIVLQY